MFTGLVEELGQVADLVRGAKSTLRLAIKAPLVAKGARIGDSIAVNGCCLTVVKKAGSTLAFDAGSETLSRTNLGRLHKGSRVNLERSLKVGSRLGGHFVTGHVDALATLIKRRDEGEWSHVTFRIQQRLNRLIVEKGSVTLDGVSLTVVTADLDRFSVALIPHTLQVTTLGQLPIGGVVNLETDLLGKYVQRQLNPALESTELDRGLRRT